MTLPLFAIDSGIRADTPVALGPGATLLPGFALASEEAILSSLADLIGISLLRHMETPGGHRMSVAMTNCVGPFRLSLHG